MPINLEKMKDWRRSVIVKFAGEECRVTYKPGAYTASLLDRAAKEPTVHGYYHVMISELVSEWDVLDETGKSLPPSNELISTLSLEFLKAVKAAILDDVKVSKDQKNF